MLIIPGCHGLGSRPGEFATSEYVSAENSSRNHDSQERKPNPSDDGELTRWAQLARGVCYKVSRLAQNVGFSPKQLRAYFNARHWGNPKQVLDRIRTLHAGSALIGGCSAKRVAIDFGYRDPSHLNRALRRHLGQSPSEFAHPATPGEIPALGQNVTSSASATSVGVRKKLPHGARIMNTRSYPVHELGTCLPTDDPQTPAPPGWCDRRTELKARRTMHTALPSRFDPRLTATRRRVLTFWSLALAFIGLFPLCRADSLIGTLNYSPVTYSATYTIPAGVNRIVVQTWGGGGNANYYNGGGAGGAASASYIVTAGQVLGIHVYSTSESGGGGDAEVFIGGNSVVYGGGGGEAYEDEDGSSHDGGPGWAVFSFGYGYITNTGSAIEGGAGNGGSPSYGSGGNAGARIDLYDAQPPASPSNLAATNKAENSFTLSWTASPTSENVTEYEVQKDSTSLGTAPGASRSITGLQPAIVYQFTVRAKDIGGNLSNWSTSLAVTLSDTTAPSAPAALSSPTHTSVSVTLTWSAATDNVGVVAYDVYRILSGATSVIGATNGTTLTFVDSYVAPSTSYSYFLKARDAAGNVSPSSNTILVTTSASGGDSDGDGIPDDFEILFGIQSNPTPPQAAELNLKTHRPQ